MIHSKIKAIINKHQNSYYPFFLIGYARFFLHFIKFFIIKMHLNSLLFAITTVQKDFHFDQNIYISISEIGG